MVGAGDAGRLTQILELLDTACEADIELLEGYVSGNREQTARLL